MSSPNRHHTHPSLETLNVRLSTEQQLWNKKHDAKTFERMTNLQTEITQKQNKEMLSAYDKQSDAYRREIEKAHRLRNEAEAIEYAEEIKKKEEEKMSKIIERLELEEKQKKQLENEYQQQREQERLAFEQKKQREKEEEIRNRNLMERAFYGTVDSIKDVGDVVVDNAKGVGSKVVSLTDGVRAGFSGFLRNVSPFNGGVSRRNRRQKKRISKKRNLRRK
jgi:hypothetical protein